MKQPRYTKSVNYNDKEWSFVEAMLNGAAYAPLAKEVVKSVLEAVNDHAAKNGRGVPKLTAYFRQIAMAKILAGKFTINFDDDEAKDAK